MKETLKKTVSTTNYKDQTFSTEFTLDLENSDIEVIEQWALSAAVIEWQRTVKKLDKIPDKVIYTGKKDKAKDPITIISRLTAEQKAQLVEALMKDLGIEPEKKEE